MYRKFDFDYHLLDVEYRELFENGVSKTDIENAIKDFIIKYHLYVEDEYIVQFNDRIKIEFSLQYCYNFEFYIVIENIYF